LARAAEIALERLAARDGEGFRAVVANALGNPHNSSAVDVMARATWNPGHEKTLLERLESQSADQTAIAPLRALGGVDAPAVREFLRAALQRYGNHAANFLQTAQSLATLGETGLAHRIAPKLRLNSWSGVRPALLDAFGRMGGNDARDALLAYLREPLGGSESAALRALARIDPAAARAEAKVLLGEDTKNPLDPIERRRVQDFLRE
jgi:hypothetical protein